MWWHILFQYNEIRKTVLITRDTKDSEFPLKSEVDGLSALGERV